MSGYERALRPRHSPEGRGGTGMRPGRAAVASAMGTARVSVSALAGRPSSKIPAYSRARTADFPVSGDSAGTFVGLPRTCCMPSVISHGTGRHRRGSHATPQGHRTVIGQRERWNTYRCQAEMDGAALPRTAQPVAAPLLLSDAYGHHLADVTSPDAGGVVTPVARLTCTAIARAAAWPAAYVVNKTAISARQEVRSR